MRTTATAIATRTAPRTIQCVRLQPVRLCCSRYVLMTPPSPSGKPSKPRYWTIRRAHSNRPATYRCPFCGGLLHAMSEHVVIAPEGDVDRRRHAHLECVQHERAAGRFPLYADVRSDEGAAGLRRLRRFVRRSS